jgi:protein-disulfide isomerase
MLTAQHLPPTITLMKKAAVPNSENPIKEEKPKKEYLEIRVPRFKFQSPSMIAYLVFTLIIFAFLLGMLTNKIIYLEKAAKTAAEAPSQNAQATEPSVAPPPAVVDVENGKLPLLGNKDAKVTIVEFSDFQCPFCKRYFDETHQQINDTYVKTGKVKFAYRHYPLSFHPNAEKAAEAAECANEQGAFWQYHDLLFGNQDNWTPLESSAAADSFTNLAGQAGIDTNQFRSCLDTGKYKANVDADLADGGKAQVDGTPTFFINGNRVVGAVPFADLQKVIEEELKK